MTTHGLSDTPLHCRWMGMRVRCKPAWQVKYPSYAGVRCDERWATFEGFLAYPPAGEYAVGMVLSRIGDIGDYSPENCRWATKAENVREMVERKMRRLPDGRFASDVARTNGISPQRLCARLRDGWTIERATTEPPHTEKTNHRNLRKIP